MDVAEIVVESAVQSSSGRFRLETQDRVEIALLVLGVKLAPFDSLDRAVAEFAGVALRGKCSCRGESAGCESRREKVKLHGFGIKEYIARK